MTPLETPRKKPSLFAPLTRWLHLPSSHPTELSPIPPVTRQKETSSLSSTTLPYSSLPTRPTQKDSISPPFFPTSRKPTVLSSIKSSARTFFPTHSTSTITSNSSSRELPIVTDYDRILDLVKKRKSVKLDEIARLLALKEEQVAQELQTLEDNGLVSVKYPAFGEPLILYKDPEA
ncbi:MAG: hypothetical protein V1776_00085 [Candidatus Diapherotrites archaeon]